MPNVHGTWHVVRYGNVLIARIEGAFNREGVEAATHDTLTLARSMTSAPPYAVIHDMRHWLLHTPDAQPVADRFAAQMESLGFTHFATVTGHSGLRDAVVQTIEHGHEVRRAAFGTLDDALSWLVSEGFQDARPSDQHSRCG